MIDRRTFIASAGAAALVATSPAIAKPAKKRIIIPDILALESADRIERDNCRTILYRHMCRVDFKNGVWEGARVGSATYDQWLREDGPFDILPHVSFGGAVQTIPGGDPTFHDRWKQYARTLRMA